MTIKFPQLNEIRDLLIKKGETVAVAESATSGLLQYAFGNVEDASKFYQGGITAYHLGQKARHLGVEPIHASNVDCVSERVADDMAKGAVILFTSQWSIAITGYATPVPESENKQFAYFSIAYGNTIMRHNRIDVRKIAPNDVQFKYVLTALDEFLKALKQRKPG